jgi:hypothetical protein
MDNNNELNADTLISNKNEELLKYLDSVLEDIFLDENSTKHQLSICEDKIKKAYETAGYQCVFTTGSAKEQLEAYEARIWKKQS